VGLRPAAPWARCRAIRPFGARDSGRPGPMRIPFVVQSVTPVGVGRPGGAQAAQPLGMPPLQSPSTLTLMIPAKLVLHGRIAPGRGSVAHSGQFRRGEQLKLPHQTIISQIPREFMSDQRLIMPNRQDLAGGHISISDPDGPPSGHSAWIPTRNAHSHPRHMSRYGTRPGRPPHVLPSRVRSNVSFILSIPFGPAAS
jgi:hypothetical protein